MVQKSTVKHTRNSKTAQIASLYIAGVFLIMALSQLFTFETFPYAIGLFMGGPESTVAHAAAAIIVTLEVLALPYLLTMDVSNFVRRGSLLAAGLTLGIWLVVTVIEQFQVGAAVNIGILGTSVMIPGGWWLASYFSALVVLLLYVVLDGMRFNRRSR